MYVCALLLDGAEDGPCKVVGDDCRLILRLRRKKVNSIANNFVIDVYCTKFLFSIRSEVTRGCHEKK